MEHQAHATTTDTLAGERVFTLTNPVPLSRTIGTSEVILQASNETDDDSATVAEAVVGDHRLTFAVIG